MQEQAIFVEIGAGELLDKISILQIKADRLVNAAQLKNVRLELDELTAVMQSRLSQTDKLADLMAKLKTVNEALWDIEDKIRRCEARKDFGEEFIALARAVYHTNDNRAAIKKSINTLVGARLVEEKSYDKY